MRFTDFIGSLFKGGTSEVTTTSLNCRGDACALTAKAERERNGGVLR